MSTLPFVGVGASFPVWAPGPFAFSARVLVAAVVACGWRLGVLGTATLAFALGFLGPLSSNRPCVAHHVVAVLFPLE